MANDARSSDDNRESISAAVPHHDRDADNQNHARFRSDSRKVVTRASAAENPIQSLSGFLVYGYEHAAGPKRFIFPRFACRFPSGQQSLFLRTGKPTREHAMSGTLNSSWEIPWWKEPSKEQWKAWIAAWLGWTLDAFEIIIRG